MKLESLLLFYPIDIVISVCVSSICCYVHREFGGFDIGKQDKEEVKEGGGTPVLLSREFVVQA